MKTKLLVAALFVATAGVVIGYPLARDASATASTLGPHKPVPTTPVTTIAANAKAKVEVVFVLDTTGSMSDLIAAAKENIWSIATTMASAKPAPEIRIGLVAFRDRGDAYVTRVVDLSGDLDSMYATLMDFQADGGGDGPESVNEALHDAVHKISWSHDPGAYQAIFLVGDAPPHMDYQDDVKYPDTIKAAVAKGIVINTIQAGDHGETTEEWRRIAGLNQGQYFQVGQSGSAIAMTTPFDEEIARLSQALDSTRMFYGDARVQEEMKSKVAATDKLHAEGTLASRAKRAAFNASASGTGNLLGENELVDDVRSGRIDLAEVSAAELPPALQALGKDERAKAIDQAATKRAELQSQIAALSEQRRANIEEQLKTREGKEDSLDAKLYDAVKEQAGKKGIMYAGSPSY